MRVLPRDMVPCQARGDSQEGDKNKDEEGRPGRPDGKAAPELNGDAADGGADGGEADSGKEKEKGDKGDKGAAVDLGPAPKFENKEDAVAAFKDLLESKCTSHKMTWAELVPLVSNDPRWRAVKSTGEKKNLFQHLMAQKQREAIDQVTSLVSCFPLSNCPSPSACSSESKPSSLPSVTPTSPPTLEDRERRGGLGQHVWVWVWVWVIQRQRQRLGHRGGREGGRDR